LQSGSGLGVLELRECTGEGGLRASARGKLTVFFPSEAIPRLREFGRGSEIYADGILSYGSRGPLFRATSVHIVKPAPAIEQFRTGLRMTLLEKFQSRQDTQYKDGAAPVWGSLASALLLGVRDDLDTEFAAAFLKSGCAYILALSGMHLAIISAVLAFLIRRPLGIRRASLVGAVFIVFYVFIAGSQPSLVRAAIMYIIGTFALWGLLKKRALSILGMAFIIQLLFQSETGISLSFILSYLALAGMLTLGETFHDLFRGRIPMVINRTLSASLGAFIATAPVVVFFFGALRPIGIIAGLLVAPLSSLFMVLTLAALAAAFLPLPLWTVFDFALSWLYRFLEFIVSLAGRVPGFSLSNPVPVLVFSGLLWLLVLSIKKQDDLYRNSIASYR
jgi:competence protein ComEC